MKTTDLKTKLSEELAEASWDILKSHFEHDVIIQISDKLDIVDIGIAVAEDDSRIITKHLEAGEITKPTKDLADDWEKYNSEFLFLIVKPYVLIQEAADSHYIKAVSQQIESKTPICVNETYKRLIETKLSSKETLKLIARCLAFEIFTMKKEKREFDTKIYASLLENLPKKPF